MKPPDDIDLALLYWFTVAILLMVVVGFVLAGCATPPVPKHDAAVPAVRTAAGTAAEAV